MQKSLNQDVLNLFKQAVRFPAFQQKLSKAVKQSNNQPTPEQIANWKRELEALANDKNLV